MGMDAEATIMSAKLVLGVMGAAAGAIVLWLAVVLYRTVSGSS